MSGLVKKDENEIEAYYQKYKSGNVKIIDDMFVDELGNKVWFGPAGIHFEDKEGNNDFYVYGEIEAGIKRPVCTTDKYGNMTWYSRWKDSECIDYTIDREGNEVHYKEDGKTVAYTKDKNGKFTYYGKDVKPVLEGDVPGYAYLDAQIPDHVGKDGEAVWKKDNKKQTAAALKGQKESRLVKGLKSSDEALVQGGQFAWVRDSQKKMVAKATQKGKKSTAQKKPTKTNGGRM